MVRIRGQKNHKTKMVVAGLTASALITVARPALVSQVYAAANAFEWERQEDVDRLGGLYTSAARSADGSSLILGVAHGGEASLQESPLYISTNSGASWENIADEVDPSIRNYWEAVDVSNDGQVMIAASSSGYNYMEPESIAGKILISQDGGDTWGNIAPTDTDGWHRVVVSGDGSKVAALQYSDDDVYISEDGGDNWNAVPIDVGGYGGWNLESISISDDGEKILVGGENSQNEDISLFISEDGGDNWADISPNPDDNVDFSSHDISADGSKIVISTRGYNGENIDSVFITENDGTSWTEITPDAEAANDNSWADTAISDDGTTISIIDEDNDSKMYISNNDGATWAEENPRQGYEDATDWRALDMNADGSKFVVASDENAYLNNAATPTTSSVELVNPETGKAINITTPDGTTITCSSAVKESGLTENDAEYQYPLGLVDFCFGTDEETNIVTLTFVTDLKPQEVVIRKYNPSTGKYSSVSAASVSETTYEGQHGLQVTYAIVDNGPLDLDADIGEISDPVGIGIAPVALADTGESASTYLFIASTLIAVSFGAMNLRKLAKRSRR